MGQSIRHFFVYNKVFINLFTNLFSKKQIYVNHKAVKYVKNIITKEDIF
jgi:hypothetical protein